MAYYQVFLFFILVLYQSYSVESQTGCLSSLTNFAVYGNDLTSVQGSSSSCCQACQQHSGCLAYTWNNMNGGTCWLKNDTQPVYSETGSFTVIMAPSAERTYALNLSYSAPNFFEYFDFITYDYSHGFVDYVDRNIAEILGLISIENEKIFIRVESNHTLDPNSTIGRPSIRIETKQKYNSGLFIFDIDHMPTGPGTWPAYWTYGPSWPNSGEIDIIEGINSRYFDAITLHTRDNCSMPVNNSLFFTGQWGEHQNKPASNCSIHQYPGAGCSINTPNGTYNTPFNQAGGGVIAMQWERYQFIRIWYFLRPNVPQDITKSNPNPNPDTWGMPTAYFTIGPNCTYDHFNANKVVINTDLCGFGAQAVTGGDKVCEEIVRDHPEEFIDAYWKINYLNVYCRPGENCLEISS